MIIYLIGGNGFVGSAYARLLTRAGVEHHVITRENWASYAGSACDVLINANGNSKKFMADRDPKWEFEASVASVVASLTDFKAGRYVLLSTGDVYPRQDAPEHTREDQAIDKSCLSRYGLHKLIAEDYVRAVHPSWLVMRMGGFVGPGMRKNAIYDILNGPTVFLHPDSELQFISTDRAAELVWNLIRCGTRNEVINLGGRGVVRISEVHAATGTVHPFAPDAKKVRFELDLTKLELLAGKAPAAASEVQAYLAGLHS